jgi:dihydroxy-acid dehydratase
VGAVRAGKMDRGSNCCGHRGRRLPTCGSCAGMFTANSMNCLTEVIGLGLPGNGTIPAVMSARVRLAKQAGMKFMDCGKSRSPPGKI